ncbi:MAG: hypothetical protein K2P81_15045 [Bacteriovoracaceae bacterium]|nr:hypothetical protein [Bacteriovoracaceae bacterium]
MLNCIFIFLCLLSSAFAADLSRVDIYALTNKGTTHVRSFRYINEWGKPEVRLESGALPKMGKVNPILGYGRDIDDDGKIETWFMIDDQEGLVRMELPSRDNWGDEAIKYKIFKSYHATTKAHIAAAYGAVFGYLLMSISHGWQSEREFWRELMDLDEFTMRLENSKKHGEITRAQWNESVDLLSSGYQETLTKFEKATGREYWALAGADIALWLSGGVIVKGLGKVFTFIGRPLAQTAIVTEGKAALGKMIGKIAARTRSQLSRLRVLKGAPVNAVASQVIKQRFPSTLRALMAKNQFNRKVLPIVAKTMISLKKAALEWRYLTFMGTLQLSTEVFAHSSEVLSPNPTEFAKNVLHHPDIMQNVGFMTSDAFLMTAASHGIKPKGVRYATCGFIALTNSTVTNLVIKGEKDYTRVALDTGWEAVIGNAQVQIDLASLKYFETKALRASNPKLKLIGWAIVLVDQAAGFVGYSQATQALANSRQQDIQLVPVLAEN